MVRAVKKAVLTAGVLTLMSAPAAVADTLLVAPTGADNDTCGTLGAPCQTIQRGVTNADAGDTIQVAAGTYRESVDVTKAVTLLGAKAGQDARERHTVGESIIDVPVDAAHDSGLRLRDAADGTIIDGFLIRDGKAGSSGGHNRGILAIEDVDGLVVRNTILRNNSYAYQQFDASSGTIIERNLFIANNNVVDESNEGFHGVFGGGPGMVVRDNAFRDHSLAAINLPGTAAGMVVERNESYGDGSFLIAAGPATNLAVRDNVIDRTDGTAILLSNVNGALVEGNRVGPGAGTAISLSGTFGGPVANAVIRGNSVVGHVRAVAVQNNGATGTTTIAFNRFARNGVSAQPGFTNPAGAIVNLDNDYAVAAENNWFGCNAGPGQPGCDAVTGAGAQLVDVAPHLVMSLVATPAQILTGGDRSAIVADFTRNSAGAVPTGNAFPAGDDVDFTTTLGSIDDSAAVDADGKATALLTSLADAGTASVGASFDQQTLTAPVTIAARAPQTVTETVVREVPGPVQTTAPSQTFVVRDRVAPSAFEFATRLAGRRFTTTGRLVLPAGVNAAEACADGDLVIRIKRVKGARTLSTKQVALQPDCSFRSAVTLARKDLRGSGGVRVAAHFFGNAVLRQLDGAVKRVAVR